MEGLNSLAEDVTEAATQQPYLPDSFRILSLCCLRQPRVHCGHSNLSLFEALRLHLCMNEPPGQWKGQPRMVSNAVCTDTNWYLSEAVERSP